MFVRLGNLVEGGIRRIEEEWTKDLILSNKKKKKMETAGRIECALNVCLDLLELTDYLEIPKLEFVANR